MMVRSSIEGTRGPRVSAALRRCNAMAIWQCTLLAEPNSKALGQQNDDVLRMPGLARNALGARSDRELARMLLYVLDG